MVNGCGTLEKKQSRGGIVARLPRIKTRVELTVAAPAWRYIDIGCQPACGISLSPCRVAG